MLDADPAGQPLDLERAAAHLLRDVQPRLAVADEAAATRWLQRRRPLDALSLAARRAAEPNAAPRWRAVELAVLIDLWRPVDLARLVAAHGATAATAPTHLRRQLERANRLLDALALLGLDPALQRTDVALALAERLRAASTATSPSRGGVAVLVHGIGIGGAQVQAVRVARSLADGGATVRVVCTSRTDANAELLEDLSGAGVEVVALDEVRPTATGSAIGASLLLLTELLRVPQPLDVLWGHLVERPVASAIALGDAGCTVAQALAALAAGVQRVVVGPSGMARAERGPMTEAESARSAASAAVARSAFADARVTLATEAPASRHSHETWMGVPAQRHADLPHRLDLDDFLAAASAPISAPWPPEARIVLGLFRAVPVKRPELWLSVVEQVLARRTDVHAVLIGGQAPELDLESIATRIGPRCHLVGPQWPSAPWLARADVLLHTSLSEGVPNACLEALALGVPAVAAAVGGIPDAVPHGELGLLVAVDAPVEAYVDAIETILDDPTWPARVAAAGPAVVRARHAGTAHLAALRSLGLLPGRRPDK